MSGSHDGAERDVPLEEWVAGLAAASDLAAGSALLERTAEAIARRIGERDFPALEEPVPDRYRAGSVEAVVWDFDYYRLVLGLIEVDGGYRRHLWRTED
jgi:hypothetical protein